MEKQQQSRKRPVTQPEFDSGRQKKSEANILQDPYEGRMSLADCKAMLNKGEQRYTDEEVLKVRDFLYTLGEIDYQFYQKGLRKEATTTSPF